MGSATNGTQQAPLRRSDTRYTKFSAMKSARLWILWWLGIKQGGKIANMRCLDTDHLESLLFWCRSDKRLTLSKRVAQQNSALRKFYRVLIRTFSITFYIQVRSEITHLRVVMSEDTCVTPVTNWMILGRQFLAPQSAGRSDVVVRAGTTTGRQEYLQSDAVEP